MKAGSLRAYFALPPHLLERVRTTAGAFAVLVALGFTAGMLRPEAVEPLMRIFVNAAASAGLYEVEGVSLMATILSNNLLSLLSAIAMGLVPFVHLPAMELGVNAMLIGGLGAFYVREGLGLPAYLAGTVPHGVFELPALVIACACGLYLCRAVTNTILGKGNARAVATVLSQCLRVYVHYVFPLLTISAFLEAFVTPLLLSRFL